MICRGIQAKRTLIHPKDLPPLTIKEALEVYYSMKRSDKSQPTEQRWKYLNDRFIFQNFGSSSDFMHACNVMLKTVNFFEEKVKSVKRNPTLKKKWNDKLNVLLGAPFHDNLNVSNVVSKFKAYEYAQPAPSTEVGVVCMNCPNIACRGCVTSRVLKRVPKPEVKKIVPLAKPSQPAVLKFRQQQQQSQPQPPVRKPALLAAGRNNAATVPRIVPVVPRLTAGPSQAKAKGVVAKNSVTITKATFAEASTSNSAKPAGVTPNQKIYFEATKMWRSKEDLKKEYWRVGKLLGYRRPASLTEVLNFYKRHGPPTSAAATGLPNNLPSTVTVGLVRGDGAQAKQPHSEPGAKTFWCPNCPKRVFKSEGDLNRHKSAKCERGRVVAAQQAGRGRNAGPNATVAKTKAAGRGGLNRVPYMPRITAASVTQSVTATSVQQASYSHPESSSLPATWQEFSQEQHFVPVQTTPHVQLVHQVTPPVQSYQNQTQQDYYTVSPATVGVGVTEVQQVQPVQAAPTQPALMPWMLPAEDCCPNEADECILPD